MRDWVVRRGLVRTAFELLLVVQLGHLAEHVVQITQIHVLGWPSPDARGLIAAFDVEKAHFVWNAGVLGILAWLLRRGVRSPAMLVAFAWAAAHTLEHGYLVSRAMLLGLESQPGILGAGGVLATLGVSLAGLTTWSRPTVHLAWNTGEVALLGVAYARFAGSWWPWSRPRLLPLAAGFILVTIALLALALSTTRADAPPVTSLAPFDIVLDGRNELVGVAAGADDACYVSDRGAGSVYRVSARGGVTVVAANLDRPAGLAVEGDDQLLIVEEHAGRVRRLAADGTPVVVASGVKTPRWLIVADNGTAYMTAHRLTSPDGLDASEGRVLIRVDLATGAMSEVATGLRAAQGLARVNGTLIVATKGLATGPESNGTLLAYPVLGNGALGGPSAWVGTGLKQPVGLAIDVLDALYASSKELTLETDSSKRGLAKVHPDRRLTDFAANFVDPQGVAVTPGGDLCLADGKSGRLYRFRAPPAPALDRLADFTRQPQVTVRGGSIAGARVDVISEPPGQPASTLADAAGRFSLLMALTPNALNVMHVFSTGQAGNGLTSPATTATLTHDDHAPTLTFSAPTEGAHVRGRVDVRVMGTDDRSGVATVAISASGQSLTTTLSPSPPATSVAAAATWDTTSTHDGVQTLSASATDLAGNASLPATRVVIVDNTPPDTTILSGPDGDIPAASATFTVTGSDALTASADLVFAWRLDGGAWSAYSSSTIITLNDLATGPHTVEVRARDRAGNEDPTPALRSFRVALGPLLATLSPFAGPVGTQVVIHGAGFTPGPVTVTFNGASAVVRSVSNNTITTSVPLAAATGPLVLTTPQGTTSHAFTVTASGDFAFTAEPANATSLPGAAVSYALAVAGTGSFAGLVSLTVTGLPPGVSAAFSPAASLAPGQIGELRLTIAADATPGSSQLTASASGIVDGHARSQQAAIGLTILPAGQSALSGRILLTTGEPVPGARVAIGNTAASSDAAGNFLLLGPGSGTQTLAIDANAARAGLPIYATDVEIVAGRVSTLPTLWLTSPPAPERFVPIANATADQVVTDARFPGVAFTLPAGATVTGWDGTRKTRIAIERVSPDRLPVPSPPGQARSLYQLFFGTPMGGVPSAPLPVTLPNELGLEPGEKAELWYYDAAPLPGAVAAWRLAGTGTVSADGQTIASDPGVGIARFCGVCGLSCFIKNQDAQPSLDEGTPEDGEPVNLAIGQHIVDAVDLLQPGRTPAVVLRTYNPFDAFGRIAGFELALGPGWTLSTDVALLDVTTSLRRLILPANARYDFVRQPDGSFMNPTNPRFRGASITLEPNGLQALRFRNGNVWRFRPGWVARGKTQPIAGLNLLIEQRDRHDNALTVARDGSGGVTALTQSDGRSITFTLSLVVPGDLTSARLTQARDALGRTVQYVYEPDTRRLQAVIDAAGGETRYTYDAHGRILSIRDQKGVVYVRNAYDTDGRVAAQQMADGALWQYAYEGRPGAHTVVRVTNPRGHTTVYRLGLGGRGDEVIDPLGQSTVVQRNARGLPDVVADPLHRQTRLEYDGAFDVSASVDREGNRWSFTYEPAFGQVQTITDPVGNVTRFEYHPSGTLKARVNPEGDRIELGYDAGGAATSVTDALGRMATYTYDAAGNVTSVRNPLGNTATFEHDAGSRLVKATDAQGAVTRWFYDALNRVTRIVDADGGASRFTYDPKGNLLTFTDARGSSTTYTYDDMDRLVVRTDPLGRTRRFAYDLNGNVVQATDAKGQITHHDYDELNRRVRTAYADGIVVEYIYDAAGQLTHVIDSEGASILFGYDALNRVTAEVTPYGIVRYYYDALGRRRTMTLEGGVSTTYGYDRNSRLRTMVQSGSGTTTLDYLPTGQLQRRALPNGLSTTYAYDDAGRVVRQVYESPVSGLLGDLTYAYDRAGRRTSMGGSLGRTLLPDAVALADYDAANQQLRFGVSTLTYDLNGNATAISSSEDAFTLTWDAQDRLRSVSSSGDPMTFGYDALGRRTHRTTQTDASTYQYANSDVVREQRNGLELSYLRGLGVDETVGQDSLAYLLDGTRSTIGTVDSAGSLTQTFAYEPFGRSETAGSADAVRYQFTGRERDADWLYYYRARYYAPRLARFLQPDPLGLRGGVNGYAYAANDPVSLIDPAGLRTYAAHGCCQTTKSRGDFDTFAAKLRLADPHTTVFVWSGKLFFDVIPASTTPSDRLLNDILRDLEQRPLEPGEKLNLIGHSAGGIIVNNVANGLRAAGIPVDNLITLGTPLQPGIVNQPLPTDVPVTNFHDQYDPLGNTLTGPNVTNVAVTNLDPAGGSGGLTPHVGYTENPTVIGKIRDLIR